jgi:hypothetical protein
MQTYKTKSSAVRAAQAFADNFTAYTLKRIDVAEVEGGFEGIAVYETNVENVWKHIDDDDVEKVKVRIAGEPRNRSTVDSPCALVWDLAQAIVVDGKGARKDVIAAAVEQGVNKYTARTQYQRWHEAYHA